MIEFDYEDEKTIALTQEFIGDNVQVQIKSENNETELEFSITQEDFIKMLNGYRSKNKIV